MGVDAKEDTDYIQVFDFCLLPLVVSLSLRVSGFLVEVDEFEKMTVNFVAAVKPQPFIQLFLNSPHVSNFDITSPRHDTVIPRVPSSTPFINSRRKPCVRVLCFSMP